MYKDNNYAIIVLKNRNNKIKYYLTSWYIGSIKILWHIIGFYGYTKYPLVY